MILCRDKRYVEIMDTDDLYARFDGIRGFSKEYAENIIDRAKRIGLAYDVITDMAFGVEIFYINDNLTYYEKRIIQRRLCMGRDMR